ncbi:CHAT domain-containing protein [Nodularia sp. UHCC 0506]|uniref:CHAT domain-containing protein n=1 Tax=Nodularia sp. UHCC 0506 TaxID=3110243 RepID=UPI002B1FF82D|nr:CHAT domain-containing protein [Nodularia sp. UHCC 0506]MEA5516757.1 CHAT domain-containing protein [Nodularia sp. UHCC 0506]
MARKRVNFHFVMESFLNKAQLILRSLIVVNRWYQRLLILLFLGVFITVGIHPVLSQTPIDIPIMHELTDITKPMQGNNTCYNPGEIGKVKDAKKLIEYGKNCYEQGDFSNAAIWLQNAVEILKPQKDQKINLAITLGNLTLIYQQQGNWQLAQTSIESSFNILNPIKNINHNRKQQLSAQFLNIQGKLQFAQGKVEDALKSWEKAAAIYHGIGNKYGNIISQINQVQALQALGLFQPAQTKIEKIEQNIEKLPANLKSKALRSLGDILRAVGKLEESKDKLEKSFNLVKNSEDTENKSGTLLSLGNTLLATANLARDREATANYEYMPWRCENKDIPTKFVQQYSFAKEKYQEAIKEYDNARNNQASSIKEIKANITEIKAKVNLLHLLIELQEWESAENLVNQIKLNNLPTSRDKVYIQINFAKSLACLQKNKGEIEIEIAKKLKTAIQDAENLKDNRAISYAFGNLGGLYEYFAWVNQQKQQTSQAEYWRHQAQKFTEEALYLAQPAQMSDIAYQWQWQLGRLFEFEGKNEKAIKEYDNAVKTLESVRGDLLSINSDVQFNFRDNIEPVYRELINLLVKTKGSSDLIQTYLKKAIKTIDSLQLAELENFLRCNLSNTQEQQIYQLNDSKTLIVYPIILEDRLSIIFKVARKDENLGYKEQRISAQQIEKTLQELRDSLIEPDNTPEVVEKSKIVYKLLIEPLKPILNQETQIKNLVFVLDGLLRNIPMSVLYDDDVKQYLVEKNYDIAVLPGFNVFNPQSVQTKLNLFMGGIGLAQPNLGLGFEKIEYLRDELDGIAQKIPSSNILIDEQFTKFNIQKQLERGNFSGIHWKTHGVFSSDPDQNFIVAYQEKIKANDLNNLIQTTSKNRTKALELLVLSACETAQGDNRAVLGLAGIAVRSGAKSTISTLWKADDSTKANTEFMIKFYQELSKPGMTKAQALHQAQLYLFKELGYNAPNIWATYILVGNWL